jgi:hypothetical protein
MCKEENVVLDRLGILILKERVLVVMWDLGSMEVLILIHEARHDIVSPLCSASAFTSMIP